MRSDFRHRLGISRAHSVIAACALLCSGCVAFAAPATSRVLDTQALGQYILEHLKRTEIPGVSIAVTHGTSVALVAGYGHDSTGAPMTASTPMFVGSVSKSFTALAVMQLVEAGRVDLDKPVHDYLKEFVLTDPRYSKITVRQLLNQSSGMSDETFFEWTTPGPASLRSAVARLRKARLAADPGSKFIYHNPNYHVAARLVEVVSGEPFSQYLHDHIFVPLGMSSTITVDRLDEVANKVPRGHVFAFGRSFAVQAPAFFVNGSAGIVTTAGDMAQWLIVQGNEGVGANGARVLSAEGMRQMQSASAPGASYGFGWFDDKSGRPPGAVHFGWLPTSTAYQGLYRRGDYAVAVLSNGARAFGAGYEATAVAQGIVGMHEGRRAVSFGQMATGVEVVLSVVALAALFLAAQGVSHSRRWADGRARDSIWSIALKLVPCVAPLLLVAAVPTIAGLQLGGRAASWLWIFYLSPVLLVFCAALAIASGSVLVARTLGLIARRDQAITA